MTPDSIRKYVQSRSIAGPWELEGYNERHFAGAVVIPSLAEGDSLFSTLESLAANPQPPCGFLAVVVVNHRTDASAEQREINVLDIARLRETSGQLNGMPLAWIDAATPGRELPEKSGGVGLARKIGFDLALDCLRFSDSDRPLLASLDADTLVDSDYFATLLRHFRQASEGGAVLPFRHQHCGCPAQQEAIDLYELYLHHHVLGLELASSPYAFHTLGSIMAFRADAYCRIGGMNRRQAGEDFYFLQQMAKTFGVARLKGSEVHPSSRASNRTPFGTGPTVSRLLSGDKNAVRFYHPDCYRILAGWLKLAQDAWQQSSERVLEQAEDISPWLAAFLEKASFDSLWERLQRQHREPGAFMRAFHGWFDSLKSLQLIHHLSANGLPRLPAAQALPPLMRWANLAVPEQISAQLDILRLHQGR